jgi:uncharacterized membrane protein
VFDEFNGLPLHPLAVHAAVALIPLAGLLGVLFAVPRTRAWAQWPLATVALAAVVATFVARESGQALERAGGLGTFGIGGPAAELVEQHEEASTVLFVLVIGYAVVSLVAVLLSRRNITGVSVHALAAVLVVGALVMGFWSYRVGDLGARAVWDPGDSLDYSS